MFITLTHFTSGNKMHFRVDHITTVRPVDDTKTLVTWGQGRGAYVNESDETILQMIKLAQEGEL